MLMLIFIEEEWLAPLLSIHSVPNTRKSIYNLAICDYREGSVQRYK